MKIRQAKKLLKKWGQYQLPFEMRTKVIKASRYSYRHRANCRKKRARSLLRFLAAYNLHKLRRENYWLYCLPYI